MSLQAITTKIKQESQAEAEAILAKANEKVAVILAEEQEQIQNIRDNFSIQYQKNYTQRESVLLSSEKQRANIAMQTVKRKAMDSVYEKALDQVLSLSENDYIELLTKKYKTLVPADVNIKKIIAPSNRERETNELIKIVGVKVDISLTNGFKGGCILMGDNFEYNLSFEHLFKQNFQNMETEIASILFAKK